MKTISLLSALALSALVSSCGQDYSKDNEVNAPAATSADVSTYDPKRGEGKWTAENIGITDKVDEARAKSGENIANTKCLSCHKLSDEKLVGPGWKDVTVRRKPEWIMNFITNPDVMIDKDPEAQAMLEICLVRMPNQNLSDEEAHDILEFMRKNDQKK
jgi:hypothetical protein